MNNNNHVKKQIFINKNNIDLSSLDNTLKTISGNRTFNLEKKSYDGKNKHNLNTKYEHLNTYNNITKRQNKSLNNDRHKTIYISNKNNSFNKINKYKQIPIYKKKEKEKDPHELTLSNPNLM